MASSATGKITQSGEHVVERRSGTDRRAVHWQDVAAETIERLRERIGQFDTAIQRIAAHVGAVCGGVDTGPDGGHTADEIIRCIDARSKTS